VTGDFVLATPDECLAEKFAYICQNPVPAGVNENGSPYVFIPDRQAQVGGLTSIA